MSDEEIPTPGAEAAEKPVRVPRTRKYVYTGKVHIRKEIYLDVGGGLRIKPWSMKEDEIEALLKKRPDLSRLWKVG